MKLARLFISTLAALALAPLVLSQSLLVCCQDRGSKVYSLNGELLYSLEQRLFAYHQTGIYRGGKLYVGDWQYRCVDEFEVGTGRRVRKAIPKMSQTFSMALGAGGKFYIANQSFINSIDLLTRTQTKLGYGGQGLAIRPDNGNFLVTRCFLNVFDVSEVDRVTNEIVGVYAAGFGAPWGLAMAKSGDLYVADELGSIYRVPLGGGSKEKVMDLPVRPRGIAVTGRYLFAACNDGVVKVDLVKRKVVGDMWIAPRAQYIALIPKAESP